MADTNAEINVYAGGEQVAEAFAVFLAWTLKWRDRTTIALSGGTTPRLLFQHLAGQYRDRIDWASVHFFWGDERCVPPEDKESNFGMARDLLFNGLDLPEANIHRIRGEDDPAVEAGRYAEEIAASVPFANGLPAFDIIMLGLGEDGHTASIFPDQMALLQATDYCAVARHPQSGQARITLTGPVINNARHVAFLVTGSSKAEVVREIITGEEQALRYPAMHIRPHTGNLYWFLDEPASARRSA